MKMEIDIYTLAHEIKNPLAVANGYLEMSNSNSFSKYKDLIMENINETLNLLNDYLEYNRLVINNELMDIMLLIEEVINNYKNLYNIDIKIISAYDELFIKADYYKLKQAFNNIIKNSIEAKASEIKIFIKEIDQHLVINILDNGNGINSFNDLNNGISSKVNGHGIGVMITKKIIKNHHGTIEYYNNDDKGCNVKINLPINI